MYAALRMLYGFCARFCTTLHNVCIFALVVRLLHAIMYGFAKFMQFCVVFMAFAYVCVRLLRVKRLVRMYMVFVR